MRRSIRAGADQAATPLARLFEQVERNVDEQYDASFFDSKRPRDDFCWLTINVETDRFSGNGGFWGQWQDVKEFAEALSAFPTTADHPIAAQWGFDMQQGDDLILRLEVVPANKRGDIAVRFGVADCIEPRNRARGWFTTNYPESMNFE